MDILNNRLSWKFSFALNRGKKITLTSDMSAVKANCQTSNLNSKADQIALSLNSIMRELVWKFNIYIFYLKWMTVFGYIKTED